MWGEESLLIVQRPLGPLISSPVSTLPVFQGGVEFSMEGQVMLPRGRSPGAPGGGVCQTVGSSGLGAPDGCSAVYRWYGTHLCLLTI